MAGKMEIATRTDREALLIWYVRQYRLKDRFWKGDIVHSALDERLRSKFHSTIVFET